MKKIKKIFALTLVVFFALTMFANAFAVYNSPSDKVVVYSNYGSKEIYYFEVDLYLEQGWSLVPVKLDNVTQLPTTFWETSSNGNEAFDLLEFDVCDYEYIESQNEIRVHYYMEYDETGFINLKFNCYNSQGAFLKEIDFSRYADYVDVPRDTTTFSIIPVPSNGSIVSGQFYYCRQVDLYAPDGRINTVYDIQSPLHVMVGWMWPTVMYSDNGDVIEVPPHKVKEYEQVGWYTEDTLIYKEVDSYVRECIADKEYNNAIDLASEAEVHFGGGKYEAPSRLLKEKAMDAWRNQTRCPVGYIGSSTGKSYGVPYVDVEIRNISYKTIIAFKSKFTCYDVFGDVEHTYYETYECIDADLGSCESASVTWDLDGASSVYSIGNFRVTEVVFADGTKWVRK